jgi:hypothetical protein
MAWCDASDRFPRVRIERGDRECAPFRRRPRARGKGRRAQRRAGRALDHHQGQVFQGWAGTGGAGAWLDGSCTAARRRRRQSPWRGPWWRCPRRAAGSSFPLFDGLAEGVVAAGSDEAAGGVGESSDDLQPTTAVALTARTIVTSIRAFMAAGKSNPRASARFAEIPRASFGMLRGVTSRSGERQTA